MTEEEFLEQRRAHLAGHWKRLHEAATKAGLTELATHAKKHHELLESPTLKLGDRVAALTKALGIPPCEGCKKRQAAMNAIDTRKPITEVVTSLARAILKP